MKKLLLFVPLVFLFTSCDILGQFLFGEFSGVNTYQQNVTVQENGKVYLIQVNNSGYTRSAARILKSDNLYNNVYSFDEKIEDSKEIELSSNIKILDDSFMLEKYINNIKIQEKNYRSALNIGNELINNYYSNGTKKYFFVETEVTDKKQEAELIISNESCNVWYIPLKEYIVNPVTAVKEKNTNINISNFNFYNNNVINKCSTLAAKFNSLINEEEKYFGSHLYENADVNQIYINNQKKIDIIVYDIGDDAGTDELTGTDKKTSFVMGYFNPVDNVYKNYVQGGQSNESQCIFVDSYFLQKDENSAKSIYSTLLHEYAHLLEFTQKKIKKGIDFGNSQTWYSEMLAMSAEDLLYDQIGLTINDTPANSRIPVFILGKEYGFLDWQKESNVLYSYGNAYTYGAYLFRNYGGVSLLKEILNNDSIGKESIDSALRKIAGCTFNYSLQNQWKIFFPDSSSTLNYTLNKNSVPSVTYPRYFNAIDIKEYTEKLQTTSGIRLSDLSYNNTSDNKQIGSSGFYIRYVGTNTTKNMEFNIQRYTDVDYYLAVQNKSTGKISVKKL